MKRTYISYISGLLAAAMLAFVGCTREEEGAEEPAATSEEGEFVTLSIPYKDLSAKEVTVTKASKKDENALNNLQVFVFNAKGQLKGYTYVIKESLVQDGSKGDVTVMTSTGDSYIYAVANAPRAAIYTQTGSEKLPSSYGEWSEVDAQEMAIDFTLDDLKSLGFTRDKGEISINAASFMMSGMANGGELCTIAKNDDGSAYISNPIADDKKLIKLHRIVSKVTVNVKTGYNKGKTIIFTPTSFDVCNVPLKGNLIEAASSDATTKATGNAPSVAEDFEDITAMKYEGNSGKTDERTFTIYIPENIQTIETTISDVHDREADKEELDANGRKVFTNAPEYGTYVVLHGDYYEKSDENGLERTADVKYYVHLGDFGSDKSDFSLKRNWHYTYNVTVSGVDDITVQVETSQPDSEKEYDDSEPGAEGTVLDYTGGTHFELDAHYDYCVMKFTKTSIQGLIEKGTGYSFRVHALNYKGEYAESKTITVVPDKDSEGNYEKDANGGYVWTQNDADIKDALGGIDISWARFLKGGTYNVSNSGVNSEYLNSHGGKDEGYRTLRETNGYGEGVTKDDNGDGVGLTVVGLLRHLYEIAYEGSEWDDDGTLTYTCYVAENYYPSLSWAKYVNQDSRVLYIADKLDVSRDERSVYATVAYSLVQHSIQTFYNTDYGQGDVNDIVAYGLETIRDDHHNGVAPTDNTAPAYDYDTEWDRTWDGLSNMKKSIPSVGSGEWESVNYDQFLQACMSRNRDLDGDGVIDGDEVRWYLPAVQQYGGMWIGENGLPNDGAKLFVGSTSGLALTSWWGNRTGAEHYFTNTDGQFVFWSEEGMATGSTATKQLSYIRCVRNVQTKGDGLDVVADDYSDASDDRVIDVSRVNNAALRTNFMEEGELIEHTERGGDNDNVTAASARVRFRVAKDFAKSYDKKETYTWTCTYECGHYLGQWWVSDHPNEQHTHSGTSESRLTECPIHSRLYNNKVDCEKNHKYSSRSGSYDCDQKSVDFICPMTAVDYIAGSVDWTTGTMEDLVEGDVTPCKAYSEESDESDKGTWRVPNQRELCLMWMNGFLTGHEGCRTRFSNTDIRYSWIYSWEGIITMDDYGNVDGGIDYYNKVMVRCVKDVQ